MDEDKIQKVSWANVLMYAGTFIAFLIGSGFATGQEVLQYFTSYGYLGIATTFTVFAIFLYVCTSFVLVGKENQFKSPNDIYIYYCGKYIGRFFDYFSTLFIYMSFFVMIAGAGATMKQQYGISNVYGGVFVTVMSALTVAFGLRSIISVLGKIGPVIVVLSIGVGLWAILDNIGGLSHGNSVVASLPIMRASTNWFLSAASYAGFCMLWLAAFVSAMGGRSNSKKEGTLGVLFGIVGFSTAILIVSLGLLAHIESVATSQIPLLFVAGKISPTFAYMFSFIIIVGIYTTAVPLLWTVSSRIINDDKDKKFVIVTIVLAIIGCFIGLNIEFNKLVNIVYVINGYVGFLLFFLMIIKSITRIIKTRKN